MRSQKEDPKSSQVGTRCGGGEGARESEEKADVEEEKEPGDEPESGEEPELEEEDEPGR